MNRVATFSACLRSRSSQTFSQLCCSGNLIFDSRRCERSAEQNYVCVSVGVFKLIVSAVHRDADEDDSVSGQ